MDTPEMFLSVIVPLYNKRHVVNRLLDSVYNQKNCDYEVIIVDDGSTDGGLEVVGAERRNLFVVRKENGGPSSARNEGLKHVRGEWVVFMDADDVFVPGAFENMQKTVRGSVGDIFCFTFNFYVEDKCGNKKIYSSRFKDGLVSDCYRSLANGTWSSRAGTTVYHHEMIKKYPFDERLKRFEDFEHICRIIGREKIFSSSIPVMIYQTKYSDASSKRNHISEDFVGHLVLSDNFWKNVCLCKLYFEALKSYPDESELLYAGFWRKHFSILLFTKIVDLKCKIIHRLMCRSISCS